MMSTTPSAPRTRTALASAPSLVHGARGLGWAWAASLSRNADQLRKAYAALRRAYLALPERPENLNGHNGPCGRGHATAEDFDAAIKADVTSEVEAWGGEPLFDRLTVGQLFVLHAAQALQGGATRYSYLPPSQETIESGGFLGGETVTFRSDGDRAVDEALAA